MEDNVIKVSVRPNKQNSVKVSSNVVSTPITANSDTSQLWSQVSKNWAVSENIVDNTDYSSKYYANKAKESASNAQGFESAIRDVYNGFLGETTEAIENVQGARDEAIANIETSRVEAIDSINSTKTTILNDIEFVAEGEKKEIEDLIDTGKDELKEAIGDVKVLTTLKIGQIGIAPLGIDETLNMERYLNGQIIIQDQFKGFTQFLKKRVALYPSIACLEDEWQTIVANSDFSQCGKFVIDDNAGTIRLPKVVNIQGLTDLSKLGEIVDAGLPNIEGTTLGARGDILNTGAFGRYSGTSQVTAGVTIQNGGIDFDASRSNPIYGNSNTVQQEQIQYPYFIQVATGAEIEDNIVNEIELNNPFSLLDYKYSEYELNNLSWLRSNGQYNSKITHPAVYDLLLKIYNGTETKAGVSVKLATETFTDYDFVLNTAEETFRLPIKVKLASGKAVVGNGMTLGLTNGTQEGGLYMREGTSNFALSAVTTTSGTSAGVEPTGSPDMTSTTFGITTDATKSGIETSDSGLYLYFYVGETVQNANLINAGRIEEKLADLIPNNSNLITNYCTPDYANGISVAYASGINYTCPADGVFSVQLYIGASNLGTVSVNGAVALRANSGSSSVPTTMQGQIIVSKGDVITATKPKDTGSSYNSAYFYPMKGAN